MKRRKRRKARASSKRASRRSNPSKRRRKSGRRRSSSAVVVVTNPAGGKKRRRRLRRRSNPSRARRHLRRRRNPSSSYGRAAATSALGFLGGAVMLGADYGVSKIPVNPYAQAAIIAGGGLALSFGVSKFASERFGAGMAGGTGVLTAGRVITAIQLAKLSEPQSSGAKAGEAAGMFPESGRVYPEGGAVYRRESGAPVRHEAGAVYPDAGAIHRLPGATTLRLSGPTDTLAQRFPAGVRVVSAHNAQR